MSSVLKAPGSMLRHRRRFTLSGQVSAGLLSLLAAGPAHAAEDSPRGVILYPTLVTEGTLPGREVEGTVSFTRSATDSTYQIALSSLQYTWWDDRLGLKLRVPFSIVEPRPEGPAEVGFGDVELMAKVVPFISPEHQWALGGGLKLTLPSGSESRGLGGTLALAPFLVAGKAWSLGPALITVQADLFYSWQLNKPACLAPASPDGEPTCPGREQSVTADVTLGWAPLDWVTAILELNSTTIVSGDAELRGRVQLAVTPGIAFQVGSWNLRAGVQVPVTSARTFDVHVLVIATWSF